MPEETRYRIDVEVQPAYLEDQSMPSENRYVFAYTVTLRNTGRISARLISRHWIIADANGMEREVRGDGVVGEQPLLVPGAGYSYTSGAILETPVGSMRGSYYMLAEDGTSFETAIPEFILATPGTLH